MDKNTRNVLIGAAAVGGAAYLLWPRKKKAAPKAAPAADPAAEPESTPVGQGFGGGSLVPGVDDPGAVDVQEQAGMPDPRPRSLVGPCDAAALPTYVPIRTVGPGGGGLFLITPDRSVRRLGLNRDGTAAIPIVITVERGASDLRVVSVAGARRNDPITNFSEFLGGAAQADLARMLLGSRPGTQAQFALRRNVSISEARQVGSFALLIDPSAAGATAPTMSGGVAPIPWNTPGFGPPSRPVPFFDCTGALAEVFRGGAGSLIGGFNIGAGAGGQAPGQDEPEVPSVASLGGVANWPPSNIVLSQVQYPWDETITKVSALASQGVALRFYRQPIPEAGSLTIYGRGIIPTQSNPGPPVGPGTMSEQDRDYWRSRLLAAPQAIFFGVAERGGKAISFGAWQFNPTPGDATRMQYFTWVMGDGYAGEDNLPINYGAWGTSQYLQLLGDDLAAVVLSKFAS